MSYKTPQPTLVLKYVEGDLSFAAAMERIWEKHEAGDIGTKTALSWSAKLCEAGAEETGNKKVAEVKQALQRFEEGDTNLAGFLRECTLGRPAKPSAPDM